MSKFREKEYESFRDFVFLLFLEALRDTCNPPILPPTPDSNTYLLPFKMELEKRTLDKLRRLSSEVGIPINILIRSLVNVVTEIISQNHTQLFEFATGNLGVKFSTRRSKKSRE